MATADWCSSAPRRGSAPTPNYHDKVADGKKWLLEHVPFYDKWYRFWLFWMLTDGIYDAVKADPELERHARARSSPMNEMLREMLIEAMRAQIAGPARSAGQGDPGLSARRQARGARQRRVARRR